MCDNTNLSLLGRAQNRDSDAWADLDALYRPLLYRYARSLGLPRDAAEEVAQETLCKLLVVLPSFDPARGRFRTWLWVLVRNQIAGWARRDACHAKVLEELAGRPGPEDDAWKLEHERRVLQFALEKVRARTSTRTWTCFKEHILKRRPSAEVGASLDPPLNAGAVDKNCSTVMKRLREVCKLYLEGLSDGDDPLPG